jgi:hypothetical protein
MLVKLRGYEKTAISILITLSLACAGLNFEAQAQEEFAGGNTAGGHGALEHLTTGTHNTALGARALFSLTRQSDNTAIGWQALRDNAANNNTATGARALSNNKTGVDNAAFGENALRENTSASFNTSVGAGALAGNTTGHYNSAVGNDALASNTTGEANTALGQEALLRNTTDAANTAIGRWAMVNHTAGPQNTAVGAYAPSDGTMNRFNTAIGEHSLQLCLGDNNIVLGHLSGRNLTSGNNNIDIGNEGVAVESSTIRIGSANQVRTFMAGISGSTVTGAIVQINAAGQLGTAPSAVRFKEEIKPMGEASEAILGLKPVTFRYKQQVDAQRLRQFGLVAEDVVKVDPDLVVRDKNGEIYTVRYDQVNAMLLNEFLKEHRHVQEQDATIASQQEQIDQLTAGLQKVTAQLEVIKAAPQTALNY